MKSFLLSALVTTFMLLAVLVLTMAGGSFMDDYYTQISCIWLDNADISS